MRPTAVRCSRLSCWPRRANNPLRTCGRSRVRIFCDDKKRRCPRRTLLREQTTDNDADPAANQHRAAAQRGRCNDRRTKIARLVGARSGVMLMHLGSRGEPGAAEVYFDREIDSQLPSVGSCITTQPTDADGWWAVTAMLASFDGPSEKPKLPWKCCDRIASFRPGKISPPASADRMRRV